MFHTLFSLIDLGISLCFLHLGKGFQNSRFQQVGCQLGCLDTQGNRFIFNFFLHISSLPSLAGMLKGADFNAESPDDGADSAGIGVDMQSSGTHLIFSLRANFQDTLQSSGGNPQTLCHSNIILDRFVDLIPADDKDTAAAQELPADVNPVLMLGRNTVTKEVRKIQNRAKRCESCFINLCGSKQSPGRLL